MQDGWIELPRTPLPRTSVNRVLKPMSVGLAPFWEMALD
jgi:hypothetical protein